MEGIKFPPLGQVDHFWKVVADSIPSWQESYPRSLDVGPAQRPINRRICTDFWLLQQRNIIVDTAENAQYNGLHSLMMGEETYTRALSVFCTSYPFPACRR